jgi:alkylhydroperoxidase family enzyme
MGHTEMCLAVAGLKDEEVDDTTRRLAGDWSDLPAAERAALDFTRKQALDPASINDADVRELERHYGPDGAWHVIWWASRCHYMTKVADAFQFPLERDNPFWSMPGSGEERRAESGEQRARGIAITI